ncbi:1-acyl-sn-glycerol-3-phosphate acyltransferase [Streptomyces sp. MBT53]|uniref:lysophospholipid acyltransferase family protein n=1 Tax=Streptomyces sp. MBT53 TaxID=1488384 RepID=UPI0019117E0C|nr:lysophospholipid acyltransferase family protein [Streptomyces sp. MBT53]MBK6016289.1 1-acyl-sn-glycerol-3-phosphate acyltransferase [Streptomyces sp. MBT53]
MLSAFARTVVPFLGHLTVTTATSRAIAPGSIVAPNHTALADPALVLAALHRLGTEPVVLATAGLWRIPVLGSRLTREGHIPVHRGSRSAAAALDLAAEALAAGRVVVLYPEGGLPRRQDSTDREPGTFRTGLARLALATGAPVVPLGHAGARRIVSGSRLKQLSGIATAPLRRPDLHVHLGEPFHLTGDVSEATAHARTAVHEAWRRAVSHLPSVLPA